MIAYGSGYDDETDADFAKQIAIYFDKIGWDNEDDMDNLADEHVLLPTPSMVVPRNEVK